jgi:segregation and condensation protein B
MERKEKLRAMVEAALFMSSEAISLEELSKRLRRSPEQIKEVIEEMKIEYQDEKHGVHLLETSKGYQLRVKGEYLEYVKQLTPYKELSRGLLRVLAMVAYKQPITQSQIVKVIGNRGYEYVKILEEKGLIRTEKRSRTKALIATKEFANYFGLETPEDFKKFFEKFSEESSKE